MSNLLSIQLVRTLTIIDPVRTHSLKRSIECTLCVIQNVYFVKVYTSIRILHLYLIKLNLLIELIGRFYFVFKKKIGIFDQFNKNPETEKKTFQIFFLSNFETQDFRRKNEVNLSTGTVLLRKVFRIIQNKFLVFLLSRCTKF